MISNSAIIEEMFAKYYILYVVLNDDSHVTLDNEAIYILYQLTMYAWEDVTMNVDTNVLWVCHIVFPWIFQ